MLENLYTTKMSANKKTLQNRFTKIRGGNGRISKITAAVVSCTVAAAILGGVVVMAAVGNEEKNFFINGKGYAIEPVLIENKLATHTDNYFVPLRKTFEALGYKVSYDVDKSKYQRLMDRRYTFPAYDTPVHIEFTDDEGNTYVNSENSYVWHKPLITNDADNYIYGATGGMNMQLPIIEMTKDGKTEYCQIGSREYSAGYAVAPVLINGTAYIPLRIVATVVGGDDNVQWNDAKHDTYFEGALTFDEETKTITVNTKQQGSGAE